MQSKYSDGSGVSNWFIQQYAELDTSPEAVLVGDSECWHSGTASSPQLRNVSRGGPLLHRSVLTAGSSHPWPVNQTSAGIAFTGCHHGCTLMAWLRLQGNGVANHTGESNTGESLPRQLLGSEYSTMLHGIPSLMLTQHKSDAGTDLYRVYALFLWCVEGVSTEASECQLVSVHFFTEIPAQKWVHTTVRWKWHGPRLVASLSLNGNQVEERVLDAGVLVSDWMLHEYTYSSHQLPEAERAALARIEDASFYDDRHLVNLTWEDRLLEVMLQGQDACTHSLEVQPDLSIQLYNKHNDVQVTLLQPNSEQKLFVNASSADNSGSFDWEVGDWRAAAATLPRVHLRSSLHHQHQLEPCLLQ